MSGYGPFQVTQTRRPRRIWLNEFYWQVQACHSIALVQWLIQVAELAIIRYQGPPISSTFDYQALSRLLYGVKGEFAELCDELDPFDAHENARLVIAKLANCIASIAELSSQDDWSTHDLFRLASVVQGENRPCA